MFVLNADDVRQALPRGEAIEAMKSAYASLSKVKADAPLRTRLSIPAYEGLSIFMPADIQIETVEALAVKIVSLFPGNPQRGLAYIQAAALVFEADTGLALALLEGGSLTAIRAGAPSGAAIDLLARKDSKTVANFGAGVQGRTQPEAASAIREKDADIICTATTSSTPVFSDSDLKPSGHISAIGSYTPEMQEVPAETIQRAKAVVDSHMATLAETGDLLKPMQAGFFDETHLHAELGEIVLGKKAGRQSQTEITYFKSVGIAVQDAVAAQLALKNADKMGIGQTVNL